MIIFHVNYHIWARMHPDTVVNDKVEKYLIHTCPTDFLNMEKLFIMCNYE
jgi:hypothetical protein